MNSNDIKLLTLLKIGGVGKKTVHEYIEKNDIEKQSLEDMVSSINDFSKRNKRIKPISTEELSALYNESEEILRRQETLGIFAVNILSVMYPNKFRDLDVPPVIIYGKGNFDLLLGNRHVAIIGTRDVTEHGNAAGQRLAKLFSEHGEIIVSGLAIGCDTSGHIGCINAGGKTIAILPGPITEILPKSNQKLADDIISNDGLLITEYYDGQEVQRGFYVDRDRLQSALSDAVVVVESDVKGGTMHAVSGAKKMKRILACYSHPQKYLDLKQAKGTQMLIEEGSALPLGSQVDIEDFYQKLAEYRRGKNKKIMNVGVQTTIWEM